ADQGGQLALWRTPHPIPRTFRAILLPCVCGRGFPRRRRIRHLPSCSTRPTKTVTTTYRPPRFVPPSQNQKKGGPAQRSPGPWRPNPPGHGVADRPLSSTHGPPVVEAPPPLHVVRASCTTPTQTRLVL